jgi:hypothetical protein
MYYLPSTVLCYMFRLLGAIIRQNTINLLQTVDGSQEPKHVAKHRWRWYYIFHLCCVLTDLIRNIWTQQDASFETDHTVYMSCMILFSSLSYGQRVLEFIHIQPSMTDIVTSIMINFISFLQARYYRTGSRQKWRQT